ncbi:hypothetical protein [Microbacterium gubbeenense]|uniref:hypothetical protein n=1 Tax=Microbacterium gubbeenense TaxID=159896 RepID=UPI003F986B44
MTQSHTPRSGAIARIRRSQGLLLPWSVALLLALAVVAFAPPGGWWQWFPAAAGVAVIVSFVVQIIIGRADGFIIRLSTAALGAILLIGIVSVVGGLFAVVGAGLSVFPAEFTG